LELLVVMVIISILFAMGIPAFQRMIEGMAPRQAAQEFVSALRSARQYAIDNNVRTRVVFADPALVASGSIPELEATNSYGVFSFYIPRQPFGGSDWRANNIGNEFSQMPTISIPSGFVGQWIPCPLLPKWRKLARVRIESPLFTNAANTNFFAANYYGPGTYWVPYPLGTNFFARGHMFSVYPENYLQTPGAQPFSLITTNRPKPEDSYVIRDGAPVRYDELWVTNFAYIYFNNTDPQYLGAPEDSSTSGRKFFDLYGIEFDSQGIPTFRWTNELAFTFKSARNTNNSYEVTVDRAVGLPRMSAP